jgi:hypothetical protein
MELAFLASGEGDPVRLQAAVAFFHALGVTGSVRERGSGEDAGDDLVDGGV